MLYTIRIEKNTSSDDVFADNTWSLKKGDKYSYIESDFGQRVKFSKSLVNAQTTDLTPEYKLSNKVSSIITYKLPDLFYVSNNFKNMSLSAFEFKGKTDDEMMEYLDDSLVYININTNDYTIINIFPKVDIVQTYTTRDKFKGCVLKFSSTLDTDLLNLHVYDNKEDEFLNVYINTKDNTDENGNPIINVETTKVTSQKLVNRLRKCINEKPKSKSFRLYYTDSEKPRTNTYFTTKENRAICEEYVKGLNTDSSLINIIEVDKDFNNIDESVFEKIFNTEKIAAVTAIDGLRIPNDILKKYKIAFVFNYNPKTGKLTNVKSK